MVITRPFQLQLSLFAMLHSLVLVYPVKNQIVRFVVFWASFRFCHRYDTVSRPYSVCQMFSSRTFRWLMTTSVCSCHATAYRRD